MRGSFYSFEGLDYCGKGTQIKLLSDYLDSKGVDFIVSREPGGTALGEAQRKLLKRPDLSYSGLNQTFEGNEDFANSPLDQKRTAQAEILMFLTGRVEFYDKIVKPNIEEGRIVIADRFLDSTVAYQGYGRFNGDKQTLDFINHAHDYLLEGTKPDTTFLLDISFEDVVPRMANAQGRDPKDIFDTLGGEFFGKVRQGYLSIAEKNPDRFRIINGALSPEEIFETQIKLYIDFHHNL